tara:strand:+ start:108 stop:605 length:498 start_codon:yes stop_codon:yes gene_type:complete
MIQVDKNIITNAVSSVTLTGIDSDDTYMLAFSNVNASVDTSATYFRVTVSGSADTTSNYDRAHKVPRTAASFANVNTQNGSYWGYNQNGTATGESQNGIMYLHNFNSSSKHSSYSLETSELIASGELQGINGGGVHTVAQSCDGIHIYPSSGNFSAGTFTLYKVT